MAHTDSEDSGRAGERRDTRARTWIVLSVAAVVLVAVAALYALKVVNDRRERADFGLAKAEGTVAAFQQFLAKWPSASDSPEATALMRARQALDDFQNDASACWSTKPEFAYTLRVSKGSNGLSRPCPGATARYALHDSTIEEVYSNTRILSDDGGPVDLLIELGAHGPPQGPYLLFRAGESGGIQLGVATASAPEPATIEMHGKEAILDKDQKPVRGAGFLQALKGKYFPLSFSRFGSSGGSAEIRLGVTKITWDDTGKATDVSGLEPVVHQSDGEDLKITSELEHPPMTNGLFAVSIEGRGALYLATRFEHGMKFMWAAPQ